MWINRILLLVLSAWGIGADTRAFVNSAGNLEYCDTEIFRAECAEGEVILMQTAKYGRMQLGRCVDRGYGSLGCHGDVLGVADNWCSGRRSCQIPVPNARFKQATTCPRDLTPYLEASFTCVAVNTASDQSCDDTASVYPSSPTSGYLANYVTIETRKGSQHCPWVIVSQPGQRINITLLDFARESGGSIADKHDACNVYATVVETLEDHRTYTVCGGKSGPRDHLVFTTLANRVEVRILSSSTQETPQYFMLRYDVVGCELPEDIANLEKEQLYERTVTYTCASSGESWTYHCIDRQWQGEVGNCTPVVIITSTTPRPPLIEIIRSTFSLSFQLAILVVVVVAIAIGLCIVLLGVCCFTSRRSRKPRKRSQKPVQAVTPTAKDYAHGKVPFNSSGGEYRKLTDLPPPPPELLKDAMTASTDSDFDYPPSTMAVSQSGSKIHLVRNRADNGSYGGGSMGREYGIITRLATPPSTPNASPHTDTTSLGTLGSHTTSSLPHATRRSSSSHVHPSTSSGVSVRQSPSVGVLTSTTPSVATTRVAASQPHSICSPLPSHARGPLSAGYNPRNSFEFPPPPPEALANNGYATLNPTGSNRSGGKAHTAKHVPQTTSPFTHRPLIDLPENDIIRYRIVDPDADSNGKKYGSLGNKSNNNTNNSAADAKKSLEGNVHYEVELPCEYGYNVKTRQKFKINHLQDLKPSDSQKTHQKTRSESVENSGRKLNSVTSFSNASATNQNASKRGEANKKIGTM